MQDVPQGRTQKCIVAVHIIHVLFEHTNRNNKVADYIYWTICQHTGLQATDKYYEHIPERVTMVPLLCGMYWLSQVEQYSQTDLI
jgi:hypothetical protein